MTHVDYNKLFPVKLKKHQLNNQGCKCRLCQKIIIEQTRKLVVKEIYDHQSQCFSEKTNQSYIEIITFLSEFDSNPRKLRFALPQICQFERGVPVCLISKKKDKDVVSIVKNKTKMHLFQIYNFFLEGFIHHNPGRVPYTQSVGRRKALYAELLRTESIALGKYKRNNYQMLNLSQIQGLFKSKQKYLRNGLIYLQTLVSSKDYEQQRIKLTQKSYQGQQFVRAKNEVKIIVGEIKSTGNQFVSEKDQLQYEQALKKKSCKDYLQYFTMKIALLYSKKSKELMTDCIFKYTYVKGTIYLLDVRINQYSPVGLIWSSSVKAAFQYKISKRMSMMELQNPRDAQIAASLGRKAHNMSFWLDKDTEQQYGEINVIKKRLFKLESQKRALVLNQSHDQNSMHKNFKLRNPKRLPSVQQGKSMRSSRYEL